jgi:hypothetical protein
MVKLFDSESTFIGRIDPLCRLASDTGESGVRKVISGRISLGRLADRLAAMVRYFRRNSVLDGASPAGRSEALQRVEETRNKAFTDIHKTIM